MNRLLAILALCLTGCVTSTVTAPDGTVTRTRRPDGKTMRALSSGFGQAIINSATDAARRRLEEERNRP